MTFPQAPALPEEVDKLMRRMHLPYMRKAAPDVLAIARCCPALKMPTKAAFTGPTDCDGNAPQEGVPAGRSPARCRFRRQGAGGSVPVSGLRF